MNKSIGVKGISTLDAGYRYTPYIPLLIINLEDKTLKALTAAAKEGWVSRKTLTSRMNLKYDLSSYITFNDIKIDTTKRRVLSSR